MTFEPTVRKQTSRGVRIRWSWTSKPWKKNKKAYNLLARYIESQTKSRCDCEVCQIHDSMPASFTLADIAKSKKSFVR